MKELVSVIIPVYNTEKYLEACVCSVLGQSYENFEVILINDGSTDQSVEICKKFEKKSEKIRFFSQENKGVSAARNVGIHYAKGQYLFFMDSDDVIHRDTLQALYCIIKKEKVEMAVAKYIQLSDKALREVIKDELTDNIMPQYLLLDNVTLFNWMSSFNNWMLADIGGKMISVDELGTLRFQENLAHGEDTLFVYQYIQKGISAGILRKSWYYYRKNEQSASHIFNTNQYLEHINVCKYIRNCEIQSKRIENALVWEGMCLQLLERYYVQAKQEKNTQICTCIKETANMYKREYIFNKMSKRKRLLFYICFTCYPIYYFKLKVGHYIRKIRSGRYK